MANHEPTKNAACGEPPLSPELHDALTLLRDRSDDADFRTLVDDVLAGRCSLWDASASAAFGKAVFAPVAQQLTERFGHLAEGEPHRCALTGEPAPPHGTVCGPGGCAGMCGPAETDPSC